MKNRKKDDRKKEIIKKIEENSNNKELIKDYVGLYLEVLEYIDYELLKDKEFCKEILFLNGMSLKYMLPEAKKDKELVLIALKSSAGFALAYADDELRADFEIVKSAIIKYKKPLKFASEDLQKYFKEKWDKYYLKHIFEKWTGYRIEYNGIRTSKEEMDKIYEQENKKNKKEKKVDSDKAFEELKEFLEEQQITFNEYDFEEKDDE